MRTHLCANSGLVSSLALVQLFSYAALRCGRMRTAADLTVCQTLNLDKHTKDTCTQTYHQMFCFDKRSEKASVLSPLISDRPTRGHSTLNPERIRAGFQTLTWYQIWVLIYFMSGFYVR